MEKGELIKSSSLFDAQPTWSPGGKALAFVARITEPIGQGYTDRWDALYTVGADGKGLTRLFPGPDSMEKPDIVKTLAWSPDGSRLAFMSRDPVAQEGTLYTIRPDGSGLSAAAFTPIGTNTEVHSLSWSPNGADILFTIIDTYRPRRDLDLYVAKADGSGLHTIGVGSYASWSPDGSRITVITEFSDAYLATMAPDGSDVQILVRKDEDGDLKAENVKCFLWFCR
jgi:Tol biopolymer transport system component